MIAFVTNCVSTYGVDVRWFESYLADHHQQVRIQTSAGSQCTSRSLPNSIDKLTYQGSALGPLLYTIYANDPSLYADVDASIVQYADDTQVLVTGTAGDTGSLVTTMEKIFRSYPVGSAKMVSKSMQLKRCL